jgi:Transposase IS4
VLNRAEASRYISLSKVELFTFFFDDIIVKILAKETNAYAEIYQLNASLLIHEKRRWKLITIEEIRIFINIYLYFNLYSLKIRTDY